MVIKILMFILLVKILCKIVPLKEKVPLKLLSILYMAVISFVLTVSSPLQEEEKGHVVKKIF